jgi:hypothetical protein
MLYDYFVYGSIENLDEIRIELLEKMQKMQCHRLYTLSKKAPTEEERKAANQEYLETVGKVRANALSGISD